MVEQKIPVWALRQKQGLDLDLKIELSKRRIIEWHDHWRGEAYVSFSGGKDSTVLLHLVRSIYPDVPAVFCNTGLEFPEIVKFVRSCENVVELRPAIPFRTVIEQYGWPVISKKTAKLVRRLQNPVPSVAASNHLALTGIKRDGTYSPHFKLAKQWRRLIDAPFRISEKCCDVMKKAPAKAYERRTSRKAYLGTMAGDSRQRMWAYMKTGCNSYDGTGRSLPLSFWLEADVWEYLRRFNVPYSTIYDMGYSRTGCMFCMFGVHLEKPPNRFQRMHDTHPKLWRYCMDKLGLRQVLDYIGGPCEPDKQLEIEYEDKA